MGERTRVVAAGSDVGEPKPRQEDVEVTRIVARHDVLSKTLPAVAKYGLPFFFLYLSVSELAGEVTHADIKLLLQLPIAKGVVWAAAVCALSVAFGFGGVLYGWNQRKLARDTVELLAAGKIAAERKIDKDRSSSGLTARGETPED